MNVNKTKDVRPFSDDEYSIIVLQCLKRAVRRPGGWLTELIIPRSIENDTGDSREIADALEHAIDAVRAQREQG